MALTVSFPLVYAHSLSPQLRQLRPYACTYWKPVAMEFLELIRIYALDVVGQREDRLDREKVDFPGSARQYESRK